MRRAALPALAGLFALLALVGCLEGLPQEDAYGEPDPGEAPPGLEGFVAAEPFDAAPPAGNVTVEQVDVGQGDGLVIHLPDAVVVVDAGPWYEPGLTAIRDHLEAEGVDAIRALVLTHPDADHAGGCAEILEAVEAEYVLHPGSSKDTRTWDRCRDAIDREGATEVTDEHLDPGHHLNLSAHARTRVLWVDATTEDVNDGSLALRLDYGDLEVDLTGDIPCSVEEEILEAGLGADVDVLKVAHHGSASSTCRPWLEATSPEVATVGVGADNTYGHPHDEVLDRLRGHGVDVYRTDLHGTVDVTSDGTGWDVRTEEGTAPDGDDGAADEDGGNASGVVVGDVQEDAPGNDNENLTREWVEVVSGGNATVDLAGWTLSDEADHEYVFPAGNHTDLAPNASLKVRTGSGNDTASDLYWGRDRAVWNNGGDTATLRDAAGALVDEEGW